MVSITEAHQNNLVADESLNAVQRATLVEGGHREQVVAGATDRRFICESDRGTFASVGYDCICSVRAYPRTALTVRSDSNRLLLAGGAALAVLGLVGVGLVASALVVLLTLLAIGATVAAELVRRGTDELATTPSAAARRQRERLVDWLNRPVHRYGDREAAVTNGRIRRRAERVSDLVADTRLAIWGLGLLAVLGFVGVIAFAGSFLAPIFALVTIVGLALADHGFRRAGDGHTVEVIWRRTKEVRIDTVDGRSIRLQVDPEDELDRTLSRLSHANPTVAVDLSSSS